MAISQFSNPLNHWRKNRRETPTNTHSIPLCPAGIPRTDPIPVPEQPSIQTNSPQHGRLSPYGCRQAGNTILLMPTKRPPLSILQSACTVYSPIWAQEHKRRVKNPEVPARLLQYMRVCGIYECRNQTESPKTAQIPPRISPAPCKACPICVKPQPPYGITFPLPLSVPAGILTFFVLSFFG